MTASPLTASQRARVERAVRADRRRHDEPRAELNVVPFLDIVMNILMFALATTATVLTAEVRPAEASCCGGRAAREALTVHVTPGGYVVGARAGFAAPGCASLTGGGAVTVPLAGGRHDAAGLTRCLATLKTATLVEGLRGQREVQVSVTGGVPHAELIRAIDAARETRPGAGDLFPEARLGALR